MIIWSLLQQLLLPFYLSYVCVRSSYQPIEPQTYAVLYAMVAHPALHGDKRRTGKDNVNGSHHGDSPLLNTKRIQIATKSYNSQVQTIRNYWASENIGYSFLHKNDIVFIMSLGAKYRLFLLYRVCCAHLPKSSK